MFSIKEIKGYWAKKGVWLLKQNECAYPDVTEKGSKHCVFSVHRSTKHDYFTLCCYWLSDTTHSLYYSHWCYWQTWSERNNKQQFTVSKTVIFLHVKKQNNNAF